MSPVRLSAISASLREHFRGNLLPSGIDHHAPAGTQGSQRSSMSCGGVPGLPYALEIRLAERQQPAYGGMPELVFEPVAPEAAGPSGHRHPCQTNTVSTAAPNRLMPATYSGLRVFMTPLANGFSNRVRSL